MVLNPTSMSMTDTPSSGAEPDFGSPPRQASQSTEPVQASAAQSPAPSQPAQLTSTLADLEGKLQELKQELSAFGQEHATEPPSSAQALAAQQPVEEPQPSLVDAPPSFEDPEPAESGARLIDEQSAIPPELPDEQAAEDSQQSEPIDQPTQPDDPRGEERLAPSLIVELLSFRERLERSSRERIEDYNPLWGGYLQERAQSSGSPAPAAEHGPVEPPSTAGDPDPDPDPDPEPYAPQPPDFEFSPAPQSAHSNTNGGQFQAPVSESPEELVRFDGHVELGVGPFYDIASLSLFESQVASLPNVLETAVRRFEASHAVLDLHLAAPVALVRELRLVLGAGFTVRQASGSRLALTFDES